MTACGLGFATAAAAATAEEIAVSPGGLTAALLEAAAGDELRLAPGRYRGNFVIETPLDLSGPAEAILDGGGKGRVLTVDAARAQVSGITVTGSGRSLAEEDAGIFLTEAATGAVVENATIRGNLIGVYIKGAADAEVRGNRIDGLTIARMNERGNGVHVWNAPGAKVVGNVIRAGRDGIFVTTSRDNLFADNVFRDLRFAVHYMYTQDSTVRGNLSVGNDVGYALMYSRRLRIEANVSVRDRDHGLMLNYVLSSEIAGNAVLDSRGKCLFFYNANMNRISGNRFEGCMIGVHYTAGSERNTITRNAFIANRRQVKHVGTRHLVWAAEGVGNYWSDDPNFDLDGDGRGDRPYRPNDMMDGVIWAHPQARNLLTSPAVELLRFAQSRLPALRPGGIVDPAPLMRPPEVAAYERWRAGAS